MAFQDSIPQFQMVDVSALDADPGHVRTHIDEDSLKGLVNAIQRVGLIHPLVVRPAVGGRFTVITGERRRQAAIRAGAAQVPVLIHPCTDAEALEVRVFENIGLGVRSALEPRDMANAIQAIAARFATAEEAAAHFGRASTWLAQATAAANLSEKVTALLDAGKIGSTSAAVQLEKLARKNEAKADSFIEQIEQLPAGEKVSRKAVDQALAAESGRSKKEGSQDDTPPPVPDPAPAAEKAPELPTTAHAAIPPWEDLPEEPTAKQDPAPSPRARVNPGKVKLVAELLGLSDDDEETVLARLIDEFLASRNA